MLKLYPIVSDNRATGYRPRPVREVEAIELHNILESNGPLGFSEAFMLDRDERGWYLARISPISPRFIATSDTQSA